VREARSVRPITAVSAWARERPMRRAKRAAWDRYRVALEVLDDARRSFESAPSHEAAEHLRRAQLEHDDAIAIAGEFQAMDLSWEVS
jgi:hypothetical protein